MTRSKWKGPYIDLNFLKNFKILKQKKLLNTISRNSFIIPKFIGLRFKVHTGKNFVELTVLKEMVGHKFGEFVQTRTKKSLSKKK